jgi:hypothetical protein
MRPYEGLDGTNLGTGALREDVTHACISCNAICDQVANALFHLGHSPSHLARRKWCLAEVDAAGQSRTGVALHEIQKYLRVEHGVIQHVKFLRICARFGLRDL